MCGKCRNKLKSNYDIYETLQAEIIDHPSVLMTYPGIKDPTLIISVSRKRISQVLGQKTEISPNELNKDLQIVTKKIS